MAIKVESISGFPEWLPNRRLMEERFITTIREQYQLYGFTPIETPAVERLDVLTAKGGIQRQIFSLGRPQEGDAEAELGLHFDLTVPLARYVAQHQNELIFPFRRYQIQKVWRGERAQRGRFREFYQCDIDIVGRTSLELIHDAEIPCVIHTTFSALGLADFQVHVSNRKILRDLLLSRGEHAGEQLGDALRAIDKSDRVGIEDTKQALKAEGVDTEVIPAIGDLIQCESIADAEKVFLTAGAASEGLDELRMVVQNAVDLGMPEERLRPNFKIARGLDYYTGTIYETLVTGREDWGSVCSGGRYDDLASFFTNQRFPGVGISIGLSRLFDLMVAAELVDIQRNSPTQVLVTTLDRATYLRDYLGIARTLRAEGISTEVYFEPHGLRDQIGYAATNGIPLAVIAGETEFEEGTLAIRDLRTRKQENIDKRELISTIREKLA